MADLDAATNVYNQCNNIVYRYGIDGRTDTDIVDFLDDVADLYYACRKYLYGTDRGYLLARGVVNGDGALRAARDAYTDASAKFVVELDDDGTGDHDPDELNDAARNLVALLDVRSGDVDA